MAAFRDPQFRLFFFGVFFSVQAVWAQRVALGWLAWELTGSAGFVGLAASLGLLPALCLGPFFGVMADRVDIRRAGLWLSMAFAVGMMAVALSLPWLGQTGLLLAATASGVISAAWQPVRMALGPRVVPHDLVAQLVSATALNFNLARLLAPAVTGWVIANHGLAPALWLGVVFHLPMVLVLTRIRARPLPPRPRRPIRTDLAEGFGHAARNPVIRLAFLLTLIFATVTRGALELLPVLADGAFDRGATGLGLLAASAGAGALVLATIRAFAAARISGTVPLSVWLACMVSLLAVIAMGAAPSFQAAMLATALAGGMATWCGISLQATIQTGLPDALRGRVMSLWVVAGFGTVAVGSFGIGALAEALGIGRALMVAGFCGLLAQGAVRFWGAERPAAP